MLKVEVDTSKENFPSAFYYTLVPKGPVDERKDQITRDVKVVGANKIDLLRHSLNDSYIITISDESSLFLISLENHQSPKNVHTIMQIQKSHM